MVSSPLSQRYVMFPVADATATGVKAAGVPPEQIVLVTVLIVPASIMMFSDNDNVATAVQLEKEYGFDVTITLMISPSFNKTGGINVCGLNTAVVLS